MLFSSQLSSTAVLLHLPILALFFTSINAAYDPNRLDTTATNAGPLTTVYTPPGSCATPRTVANYGWPEVIQGCEGPYGGECCPDGWRYDAYFSPGRCPLGYKTCTLSTSTQRAETTAYCCPDGFTCRGQSYCAKSLNTKSTMTYVDSTLSTQKTIYAITASPIQVRFKAAQSTIVPVPTDSLGLPQHILSNGDKVKIGIAVPVGVILLSVAAFVGWRHWRTRRENGAVSPSGSQVLLTEDRPPPYSGADEDTRSRMDRLREFVKR